MYYRLTKPGIIYGNAIAAIAGFFLASRTHINILLLIETIIGMSLVIGSACVFNNYIDRGIDQKMKRTMKRATVTKDVSGIAALTYATILGIIGFSALAFYTNWLTVGLGIVAYVTYIVFYGISKRESVHGTLVGSIAGALPPAAGYTAVTGRFDLGALLLFLILVCWQMPHFYAIAMYRYKDYSAASLPVLPVKKSMHVTKVQMLWYIAAFTLMAALLTVYGYTGYLYLAIVVVMGVAWFVRGVWGFKADDTTRWARNMFFFSLIVLLVLCIMLVVDGWLF